MTLRRLRFALPGKEHGGVKFERRRSLMRASGSLVGVSMSPLLFSGGGQALIISRPVQWRSVSCRRRASQVP